MMKNLLLAALLSFVTNGAPASETREPIDSVMASLQSADVHLIPSAGAPPASWLMRPFRTNFLKYTPEGNPTAVSETCRFSSREPRQPRDFAQFQEKLQRYMRECETEFQNGPRDAPRDVYSSMMSQLEVGHHPYARHVIFDLPGGVQLKGFLALHDARPRPLVVFRLGIFSNTEEFYPERFLFMQLFEQGPFNMLLLESMTGPEFVKRNQARAFAGLDESVENLQVLHRLRDPKEPISRLISSLHLAGMSMGGHGQLLTHLLQARQGRTPWVNSTLLFCPLIDFKKTFENHFASAWTSRGLNVWARAKFPFLLEQDPGLDGDDFLERLMRKISTGYQGPLSDEAWIRWPLELKNRRKDFWQGNDFWNAFKDVPTPLLIFATRQDPIVPYALNADLLESGRLTLGRSPWMLVPLKEGYHCSMPGPYDWGELTSILQSYVATFAPEMRLREKRAVFDLADEEIRWIRDRGFHPRLRVESRTGEPFARVHVDFLPGEATWWWHRLFAPRAEYRLALADFDFLRTEPPSSAAETDLYRRWVYQNLRVESVNGERLRFSWRRLE